MTTAALHTGLYASLAVTVVVLAGAIFLAHKRKTNAHIAGIGLFLVSFVITLYFAETLGRRYDFEAWSYRTHMVFAITGALGAVAPLLSGFLHWRDPKKVSRGLHKKISLTWFAVIVGALATGGWMLSAGSVKPEHRDAAAAAKK